MEIGDGVSRGAGCSSIKVLASVSALNSVTTVVVVAIVSIVAAVVVAAASGTAEGLLMVDPSVYKSLQ